MKKVILKATIASLANISPSLAFHQWIRISKKALSTELRMQNDRKMNNLRSLQHLLQHPNTPGCCDLNSILSKTIPILDQNCYKGSSGRIGIVGGSEKYSGAPYYAAMSALRTGADLSTVFCAVEATVAIKSYSPELMVDSVYCTDRIQSDDTKIKELEVSQMAKRVTESLDRLHSLVIGPGLGRDPGVMDATALIIKEARKKGISMVLDADALYLLSQSKYHDLISCLETTPDNSSDSTVVLTPNVVEYKRLLDNLANGSEKKLKEILPGVVIVKKGHHDVIERFPTSNVEDLSDASNNCAIMISEEKGGMKRSGGIGDILAGTIGVFLAWNQILSRQDVETDVVLSCWVASSMTKRATRAAFEKRKRSMTAPDVLDEVGAVVDEIASSTIAS